MPSVTIQTVARAAGVSIKTVSRVLNLEPSVRPETRARVLEAAEALRYRPNVAARSLAGSRSYLIGLFFDNPSPAYVSGVQLGAVSTCREAGYHLTIEPLDSQAGPSTEIVGSTIATLRLDGVILTPPVSDDEAVLEMLEDVGTPYVRVAPDRSRERAAHVFMDDARAAHEMTALLIEAGHRDIGFILGHPDHGATHLRFEGYEAAMREAGLPVRPERVKQGRFSFRSGFAAAEELLAQSSRPTAVFASNDDMALGVMAAANRLGLSVPDDLSVAGFDDTPGAKVVWPQLTTVRQPIFAMGAEAARMLISGQAARREDAPAASRMLDFEVVRRESVGPPRA